MSDVRAMIENELNDAKSMVQYYERSIAGYRQAVETLETLLRKIDAADKVVPLKADQPF